MHRFPPLFLVAKLRSKPEVETVMKSHLASMYRASRAMAGRHDDAEDLVHDACVKGLAAQDQASGFEEHDIKAWLNRILINTFRDSYRRSRRLPVTNFEHHATLDSDNNIVEMVTSTDPSPIESTEHRETSSAIENAFIMLPPEVRVVSVFFLLNGLSYREIADITESPIGTVMSRLARGRKMLRSELLVYYDSADNPNSGVRR
ncbi:MAG: RNA polymerase sigma-70 factor (ECF subfamily) [Gammaproteobacteria bacterium]|jgi:RNA polymerase sigma-70 factor (ECF subfamily)